MALALAVLAIFAVIAGVISFSSRGTSTKTDAEASKAMAQAIVGQANTLFAAIQRAADDRDLKNMVLAASATSPAWGLYDPTYGLATDLPVPGAALTTATDTSITLDKTSIKIIGIGSAGTDQLAIALVLPNVTTLTCHQINKLVSADAIDTAIPTVVSTTAVSRREGCATIGANLTYYKVVGSAI
jgi:hypothetical protein